MSDEEAQKGVYDLSVIVPVYNAGAHLEKLARDIFALEEKGLRCQMICVDDASTDDSVRVLQNLAKQQPDLIVIEHDANCGAGIARNNGWSLAEGRYSIFFDADDILNTEVIMRAIRDMDDASECDVAIFAYRYERDNDASFVEMNRVDREIFGILLPDSPLAKGKLEDMARLLGFTNYPWNKIIRTAHYRKAGMRFGRTKVNNDILGHWHSLLLARQIMVCDAILCTHIVHPGGTNLTNSFGAERLVMFEALEETYDFLAARPSLRRRYAHHFWDFVNRITSWARMRLDPALRTEFDRRRADLLARLDLGDLARMRSKLAPALATSLVNHLIR